MADEQKPLFDGVPIFSERFMQDHAGRIVSDPRTALLELVANSYDAGATQIEIDWPEKRGEDFSIRDNGLGMTEAQFSLRWRELCYDRARNQGNEVVFPPGSPKRLKRKPLGQHGKGRHAPFCFSDTYLVTTQCEGKSLSVEVTLGTDHASPFVCNVKSQGNSDLPHGTCVSARVDKHHLQPSDVVHLLGTKFLVDPSLTINVNGERVDLLGLEGVEKAVVELPAAEPLSVYFIDSVEHTKTTQLRGITWWVNTRMVGEHSWERLDASEDTYLDGRTEQAKRISFVVVADALKSSVKPDWSGFRAGPLVNAARDAIHDHVTATLDTVIADNRQQKKRAALEKSAGVLRDLPPLSKKTVGSFVTEVQKRCPKLSDRDLSNATEVLANLEQSRAGYDLLGQLASCSPDDLDT
ncbi:MAG: ATP-binding protein, partial [Planctomycetota bacterium]